MLALAGVSLTQYPRGSFDATGVTTFDAGTGAFDVAASPTSMRFDGASPPMAVVGMHGDVQIHIRVGPTGALLGGVAGDDLVISGSIDTDGDTIPEYSGVLLRGEVTAFGSLDVGSNVDGFDFKFTPTGGELLALYPAGTAIGVTMSSEHSSFTGSFTENFTGGAKGDYGPINAPGRISGFKFEDQTGDGLSADDTPLAGTLIYLDTNNNQSVDSGEAFTFSAADGSYAFDNLLPGTYVVREVAPIGTLPTAPAGGSYSVTLGLGEVAGPYNFANTRLVSISGTKYNDVTGNGLTGDDTPLGGVTVYLDSNDNGSLDSGETSATTAPDGTYSFTGLLPGTYVVREVAAPGTVRTAPNPSDKYVVTLTSGQTATGKDFANATLVSISGKKFTDITGNGLTGDDTPLGGVTVYIDANNNGSLDSGETSTTTAGDGSYSFTGLMPGTYIVREVVAAGSVRTAPAPSDNYSVTLTSGQSANGKNFANTKLVSISGKKYKDLTGNGITSDDLALGGVTIYIDANNNGSLDSGETSTTTAADGTYSFAGLMPGTYIVREVVPAGYYRTAPSPTDNYSVSLTSGQTAAGKNFANAQQLGRISGKKFLDATGNGLTSDDGPLGGVVVYIDANNNGAKDSGERSTTTAADGTFAFDNVAAGTYTVREVVPSGYVRTAPTNSDKYTVTLSTGQTVTGINFANAETCDLDALCSVSYTVNGTCTYGDLRGNTNQGDSVTVTFTILPGHDPHRYTLVSYTAPGATFDANTASQQRIYDVDTGVFGPGTYTLTVNIPDCFFQIDFVCGAAIDQLGPAGSNIFYSAQGRLVSADNDGTQACCNGAASLSGAVWLDDDNDGVFDASEQPIEGAKIVISWTQSGTTKSVTRFTDSDGKYLVGNLSPSFVYKITESQPSGYTDGKDALGNSGGTLANDSVSNIGLTSGENASGYNFGERNACDALGSKDVAAVSFWTSTAGQNLIKSFNGGSSAETLGMWLGQTFPKLFGSSAGTFNLLGKTNSQVAASVISRASSSSTNLEAQVLATALSVYATNSALAGGTMASAYGFTVNLAGSGLSFTSIGSVGTYLGMTNNSSRMLLDILTAANNSASGNGMIYSGNTTARTNLYNYFRSLNGLGGIV